MTNCTRETNLQIPHTSFVIGHLSFLISHLSKHSQRDCSRLSVLAVKAAYAAFTAKTRRRKGSQRISRVFSRLRVSFYRLVRRKRLRRRPSPSCPWWLRPLSSKTFPSN